METINFTNIMFFYIIFFMDVLSIFHENKNKKCPVLCKADRIV